MPSYITTEGGRTHIHGVRKRGGIWWIDVRAPNGERIRRTAETANKALAQEFHDRVKSELWRLAKLGMAGAGTEGSHA